MAKHIKDDANLYNKKALIDYLSEGCKPLNQWRIGTEYEQFPFYSNTNQPVPYNGERGISTLLKEIKTIIGWEAIMEKENIIGLRHPNGETNISLEPGGQFEFSGSPLATIHQTYHEVHSYLAQIKKIANTLGISFLGIGSHPAWTLAETPIMPKSRYRIMSHYMKTVGTDGLNMMYRTSTIQVNLDFSSEKDMRRKMQVAMKLQPIATALFAASPFTEGKPNGFLSWRSEIWRHTDKQRTGILDFVFSPEFCFSDYVEWALDIPMYFIIRNTHYYDARNITFRQFMNGALKEKIPNSHPRISDWENHLSTLFPEIRLKKFLEMRGSDSSPWQNSCALPAYWTGLLYDQESLRDVETLTKDWTYSEIQEIRNSVPTLALKTPFRKTTLFEFARETIKIATKGLTNRHQLNKKGKDETLFLHFLEEITLSRRTLAEKMLQQYQNQWLNSINPLFLEDSSMRHL
ncbi:MAG: glutamate--cysteine ligase [Candidatus Tokpelaia sp. JSC161]|jgi:glutamate--cysteine ligase|nr:MAG: glutamate--cysteine ligase [Candidatus Tokpelaia sp. JSC161]